MALSYLELKDYKNALKNKVYTLSGIFHFVSLTPTCKTLTPITYPVLLFLTFIHVYWFLLFLLNLPYFETLFAAQKIESTCISKAEVDWRSLALLSCSHGTMVEVCCVVVTSWEY